MAADALVAVGVVVLVSVLRFGQDWVTLWAAIIPRPLPLIGAYAVVWVVVLTFHGLYRPRARWSLRSEAAAVLRATITMALLTLSVLFLFRLPDVSRLFLLALFPAQAVAMLAIRAVLRLGFESLRRRGYNTRYVLVVGAGPRGQAFARRLEDHTALGLRIVGFLDDPAYADLPDHWPYLGTLDQLEATLHHRVIDEVAICLPFAQWDLVDSIAAACEDEGKIVRIPMDILDRTISTGRVEELDGMPVFSLVTGPDRAMALGAKRLIDLVGAIVAISALSPILLACMLAILVDDGRPIFFRQRRVGLHGRSFTLFKFRSMTRNAEALQAEVASGNEVNGRAFKMTNDPRITRVGRLLRRTSADELPQLLNVMRGDMSLVGPRPPLPGEVEQYDLWHRRRLSMKPGITGLWQVRARRDPDFNRWVAADLEYIDRWSLWLDLRILIRTIPAALQGR